MKEARGHGQPSRALGWKQMGAQGCGITAALGLSYSLECLAPARTQSWSEPGVAHAPGRACLTHSPQPFAIYMAHFLLSMVLWAEQALSHL